MEEGFWEEISVKDVLSTGRWWKVGDVEELMAQCVPQKGLFPFVCHYQLGNDEKGLKCANEWEISFTCCPSDNMNSILHQHRVKNRRV